MPALPPPTRLKALIEQALKERAPETHRRLKEKGELANALEGRADAAQQSFETALSAASERALQQSRNLADRDVVSEIMQARNEAARVALDQAIDFTAPEPRVPPYEVEATPDNFKRGTRPQDRC